MQSEAKLLKHHHPIRKQRREMLRECQPCNPAASKSRSFSPQWAMFWVPTYLELPVAFLSAKISKFQLFRYCNGFLETSGQQGPKKVSVSKDRHRSAEQQEVDEPCSRTIPKPASRSQRVIQTEGGSSNPNPQYVVGHQHIKGTSQRKDKGKPVILFVGVDMLQVKVSLLLGLLQTCDVPTASRLVMFQLPGRRLLSHCVHAAYFGLPLPRPQPP